MTFKVPNNCCEKGSGASNWEKNALRKGTKLNANSYEGNLFSRLGRKTKRVRRTSVAATKPTKNKDFNLSFGKVLDESKASSSSTGDRIKEYS